MTTTRIENKLEETSIANLLGYIAYGLGDIADVPALKNAAGAIAIYTLLWLAFMVWRAYGSLDEAGRRKCVKRLVYQVFFSGILFALSLHSIISQ